MKMNMRINWETRLCKVDGKLGYFHCFEQWANVIGESPLIGGHSAGQISQVYGIVEFEDGVKRVNPTRIKFVDHEHQMLYTLANSSIGEKQTTEE